MKCQAAWSARVSRKLSSVKVQKRETSRRSQINVVQDNFIRSQYFSVRQWKVGVPRVPLFYTLTKIHKPTPVGRPMISGCDGPTERISSFVDYIRQPIAKAQKSYLKDTTDLINFIERTKIPKNTTLVSMDVTSLYTKHSSRRRNKNRMQSIRSLL